MQDTPKGSRLHIAIFGRRNAGKSSLINALTNQEIALVSDIPGTTTDPVYKAMEILPIGPVILIDTAGIDDEGTLGELRVEKTKQVMNKTDVALVVIDANTLPGNFEKGLISQLKAKQIPIVGIINKIDISPIDAKRKKNFAQQLGISFLEVSAKHRRGMEELKRTIIRMAPDTWEGPSIVGDLLDSGDLAVLVIPIDLAAPKGRLILPQVQTLRDILDHDAYALVVKERELRDALRNSPKKPKIVITDSQAFLKVNADTPPDILLTSFSILFARHKGELETLVAGAKSIEKLKPGDRVLISEGCTHHRQADDIGKTQIPRWLRQLVGGELEFTWAAGSQFPADISKYQLIVHCGACMINRREMLYRIFGAKEQNVPIVNYGVLIAYVHGILHRALSPFPLAQMLLED